MARNNRPIIIGAAVLGVLALLSTMFVLFSGGGSAPTPTPGDGTGPAPLEAPKQVQYEAIRDIPPRTLLTSSLFRPIDADSSNAIPGALTNLDELNGRLSNETIGAGQIVTRDMTVEPVARVIPANIPIPPNTRAVAIFVDPNQTAAGLVDRGDRVDVIATHTFPVTTAPNQRVSGAAQVTSGRVIAQDLLVLAVDKSIAAPPKVTPPAGAPQDPNAAPPAVGAPPPVPTPVPPPPNPNAGASMRVLLAAPIEVAARLVAAEQDGKLHIVIRNPSTTEQFPVPEAREYPSRVVQNPVVPVAKPAAANTANTSNNSDSGGSSNGNTSRRRSNNNDMMGEPPLLPAPNMNTTVSLPPAAIPPANNNAPVVPPPAAPQEKEITVIRGTEKTRVIVPR